MKSNKQPLVRPYSQVPNLEKLCLTGVSKVLSKKKNDDLNVVNTLKLNLNLIPTEKVSDGKQTWHKSKLEDED